MAGECRKVNIAKGGLQFSHALLVPGLMADLERGPLACHGRIVRVIAMRMGLQAGLPPQGFPLWRDAAKSGILRGLER